MQKQNEFETASNRSCTPESFNTIYSAPKLRPHATPETDAMPRRNRTGPLLLNFLSKGGRRSEVLREFSALGFR